jgi:hypothetical protein
LGEVPVTIVMIVLAVLGAWLLVSVLLDREV